VDPRYSHTWREWLDLPEKFARAAILGEDDLGISMRQNSPFCHAMGRIANAAPRQFSVSQREVQYQEIRPNSSQQAKPTFDRNAKRNLNEAIAIFGDIRVKAAALQQNS
jgi:hypothetical protein